MRKPFEALVAVLAADFRGERDGVRAALRGLDVAAFAPVVLRHKCVGALWNSLTRFDLHAEVAPDLAAFMRDATRAARAQSLVMLRQLDTLVETLNAAQVEFVLLKGAARLYAAEPEAHLDLLDDIDVLIRERDVTPAKRALKAAGYQRAVFGAWRDEHHRHHHLAPFVPPGDGVALELHLALSPPGRMSLQFDWERLAPYVRALDGPAGRARALNLTGTALHRAIHGAGLARLHDIVLLARAFSADPCLPAALGGIFAAERNGAVGAGAAIALAARLANVAAPVERDAERYAAWALLREGLPARWRNRTQLVDAWYLDRRRFGPAALRALRPWQTQPTRGERVHAAVRAAGRLALAAVSIPMVETLSVLNLREQARGGVGSS
jgi:hypothetical protein